MLYLKNGKLLTMGGAGIIENGAVLIENGKITSVGNVAPPPCGSDTIDLGGRFVLPGLIDAHSHIGATRNDNANDDANELTNPLTPELDIVYGLDGASAQFARAAADGITTSLIVPGSGNVICGLGAAVKSAGASLLSRVVKSPACLKAAVGINPKAIYAAKSMPPMTRMGVARFMREYFTAARDYMRRKETGSEPPEYDEGLEHGIPVLKKEIPLKVHCFQHDIMTVLAIAREFDILVTFDHAQGVSDFLSEMTDPHVAGVIYGPVLCGLDPGECCKVDYEALPLLDSMGVCVAVMTDGPITKGEFLMLEVGEAVRRGMNPLRALRMVTVNAARLAGVEDRVGTLEVKKDADIAVFSGMPGVDTRAENIMTVIDGAIVYNKL